MKYRHVIVALAVSAAATFGPAYGQTTQGQSVGAAIEQIASGLAGRIGFAAQEIGGDKVIAFNGDETFAMASTYKVAIATTVLDRVDKGELSLDQLVEVPLDMYRHRRNCACRDIPAPRDPALGGEPDRGDDHGKRQHGDRRLHGAGRRSSGGDREPAQARDHRFQGRSDYPRDSHGFLRLAGGHARSCR